MQRRIQLTPYNRSRAIETVRQAPDGWFFMPPIEPNATLEQKKKMWAMLGDFSRQIKWEINGHKDFMADTDWKDLLTASMANEKRIAKGLRGGFVSLGVHTSEQSKRWMSEFIAFMYAEGDAMGVRWTEPVDVPGWYRDGAPA